MKLKFHHQRALLPQPLMVVMMSIASLFFFGFAVGVDTVNIIGVSGRARLSSLQRFAQYTHSVADSIAYSVARCVHRRRFAECPDLPIFVCFLAFWGVLP